MGEYEQRLPEVRVRLNYFRCRTLSDCAKPWDDLQEIAWLTKREAYGYFDPRILQTFPQALAKWFDA